MKSSQPARWSQDPGRREVSQKGGNGGKGTVGPSRSSLRPTLNELEVSRCDGSRLEPFSGLFFICNQPLVEMHCLCMRRFVVMRHDNS